MLPFVGLALFAGTSLFSVASAQGDPKLTGTWSTKSNKVFTGPVSTTFGLSRDIIVPTKPEEDSKMGCDANGKSVGILRPCD